MLCLPHENMVNHLNMTGVSPVIKQKKKYQFKTLRESDKRKDMCGKNKFRWSLEIVRRIKLSWPCHHAAQLDPRDA